MRKFLGLVAALLTVCALAAPALAQDDPVRDPFAPLITPTTAPVSPVPGQPVPAAPTAPVAPAPTDPLPSTGSSTSTWVGIAYLLVAFGGGAVVLSKVFGPVTAR